jgi:2-oxoglutarate dehydrogenase E2 component (dihydrolipoamide succinyltransferase)
MKQDVLAPSVGESISEVSILNWKKQNGELVKAGDVLLEIESDKATVEVAAETAGVLSILKPAGERIAVGSQIGTIDPSGTPSVTSSASSSAPISAPVSAPQVDHLSPAVRKMVTESGVDPLQISGSGKDGRVTKGDVIDFQNQKRPTGSGATAGGAPQPVPSVSPPSQPVASQYKDRPGDRRVPMTALRLKIAERLVQAQHTAAILTTFNEVDMSAVMRLRSQYKEKFQSKHGVPLSFMSFFARGACEALKAIPAVNAQIDGKDVVYRDYVDLGIAVGTDRGLVVPVIRQAQSMDFVQLEKSLGELALRARNGKLSIADMSGGSFTISNGGTYGSLLSTPILNPPQSGILGMHKIQERAVVVEGKIEVRPMMYLALSYDHRLIDGKEAVTFLVTLKDHLENPEKLGLGFTHGL